MQRGEKSGRQVSWEVAAIAATALVGLCMTSLAPAAQIQLSKPKYDKPRANPMVIAASRDEVLKAAKQMLETRAIPLDKEECNQQSGQCVITTKPVIFIRGITTKSQLEHYCNVPAADVQDWERGRYSLKIQVNPASTRTAEVGIYGKFEGMTNDVVGTGWVAVDSKGVLESEMLGCLEQRTKGEICPAEQPR